MLTRLIAILVGSLVTFGFLVIWDATDFMDPIPAYAVAALLGAIGAVIWPVIIGWWLVSRRRDKMVAREIEKQTGR